MGKSKSKRKRKAQKADPVQRNRMKHRPSGTAGTETNRPKNPFDVKLNRNKHQVLGRVVKHDRGLPGISKQKSVAKRKNTLLKEYQLQGKSNLFLDKRIGEKDGLSNQDKAMARLVAHRRKAHKHSIYNLNEDDEELTHLGKPVSEIEKCKDIPSDSDSDENLDADFVSKAHFGGFLTKKEPEASHKDVINELILQSKQRKHEKQVLKDVTVEMTEKLDEKWKEVRQLIPQSATKAADLLSRSAAGSGVDAYDIMVRDLKFDARGHATDRMKTEEEIAKEEKEKLEKLEMERRLRMKGYLHSDGDGEKSRKQQHRSADDLDDGFELDAPKIKKKSVRFKDISDASDKEGERSEEETKDDDEEEKEEDEKEDDDDEEETGSSDNDSYLDLDLDKESDDEQDIEAGTDAGKSNDTKLKPALKVSNKVLPSVEDQNELPYVIPAPSTYEEFASLVSGRSVQEHMTAIERILKCNHPSLQEGNKEKLEVFYGILLQYFQEVCRGNVSSLDLVDPLTTQFYSLAPLFPIGAAQHLLNIIQAMYDEFEESRKCNKKVPYPGLDVLLMLKLACVLYSVSDFSHPVVTPCMLFMSHILTECAVITVNDVLSGLLTCSIFLQCVSFSKRVVPEALNFLRHILEMAIPQSDSTTTHQSLDLSISGSVTSEFDCKFSLNKMMQGGYQLNDATKCAIIKMTIDMMNRYAEIYTNKESFVELFAPLKAVIALFPEDHCADSISKSINTFKKILETGHNFKTPLVMQKNKPKPLKLYEPRLESDQKQKKKQLQKSNKKALLPKYKRELKGAMREIRRDSSFLARHMLEEQIERDKERKRKVNKLMQELAEQEGSFRALKKSKK